MTVSHNYVIATAFNGKKLEAGVLDQSIIFIHQLIAVFRLKISAF
jgi:hypothetical protein